MTESNGDVRLGVLCGSLRKASHSQLLARCLPDHAPVGVTIVQLPTIGALPHFNQDLMTEEGNPASVAKLAATISDLDGMIIVSPEYNWSIPGALKNALDWLSRLEPMPMRNLPVMIVTSSPGLLGGARAHPPIRNILHSLDCRILARPEVQIAQVAKKLDHEQQRISAPETVDFIASRLAAFAAFAR